MSIPEEQISEPGSGATFLELLLARSRTAPDAGRAMMPGAVMPSLSEEYAAAGYITAEQAEIIYDFERYHLADDRILVDAKCELITVENTPIGIRKKLHGIVKYLGDPYAVNKPHSDAELLAETKDHTKGTAVDRSQLSSLRTDVSELRKLIRDNVPTDVEGLLDTRTGFIRNTRYGYMVVSNLRIAPEPIDEW